MGCGYYVEDYQDAATRGRAVDELTAEIVGQVQRGAWGTDVRAGIIGEIGCQAPWTAHEEGGERVYAISTQRFVGDNGRVTALEAIEVEMVRANGRLDFKPVAGTERTYQADLVLLAMGFLGPERSGPIEELGLELTERGNVARDQNWMTSAPGVFTCGDMQRGQSLIVWAIAEGRSCARGVDLYLMGESDLPAPLS